MGTGAPDQARRLEERGVPFSCLLDPERNLYRALGIRRVSPWQWLTWRMWRRYLKAFWQRYVLRRLTRAAQGRLTGDITQLPGVIVLDEMGRLRYLRRGTALGDYPPFEELMENLRDLSRATG